LPELAEAWVDALRILDGTLRLATPLILCAMAGLVSERSGVIDIGLEGKLLIGAFAAAAVAALAGSAWLALGVAILVSTAFALVHGFACITHKGEQIISGVAINILASGLSVVLGIALFRQGGQTPPLMPDARFTAVDLPGARAMAEVPVIGPLYAELVSGHNLLVYLALLSVVVVWWTLYRTSFGLRVRAVGESPEAVDSAGISVAWLRYRGVLIAGLLCGVAGAYLSIAHGAGFVREMSAGKGFIALAAMIFGKWRPWPTLGACLLFGFLDTAGPRLQGVDIPFVGAAPVALIPVLPYIVTVILLAGFFGRAIPPRALGIPYVKEH
jgi:general nucleoside transport system permease protein